MNKQNKNITIIFFVMIFLVVISIYFINKQEKTRYQDKDGSTYIAVNDLIQFKKNKFNVLPESEKIDIINKGYFSTCEEVLDYCKQHIDLDGCVKYCEKYLVGE